MKKLITFTALIIIIFSGLLTSCKSTKSVSQITNSEEIKVPFMEEKYKTDKNFIRASQSGLSPDLATSKKIAVQNAKTELASNIQTIFKAVTDNYTNQRTIGNKIEFENKFEELSRQVTNQKLSNIRILDEKIFKEKDGSYRYWVVIEMSKEDLVGELSNQILKDERYKLDFDKYQYEKILEQEMEKFQQNN
jgi:rubrerythrin